MTTSAPPDVSQLAGQKLPKAAFPAQRGSEFRVHFDPAVHKAVHAHASEDVSVEICGVLVGKLQQDDDGPFALITASIRGESAANKFAEVTFTHDTWTKINQEMDAKYADLSIVGWYHTHPDFGIFLSDRDRFIHEHFFNGPGQTALVVDPVRKIEGVFRWKQGKPVICERFWVGNELRFAPPDPAEEPKHGEHGKHSPAQASESSRQPPSRTDWMSTLLMLLMAVCAFMVGSLYGTQQTQMERALFMQGLAVEWYKTHGTHLGLSESLDELSIKTGQIQQVTKQLLETPPAAGDDGLKARGQDWQQVLNALRQVQQAMLQLKSIYGLTPEETRAVSSAMNAIPMPRPEPPQQQGETPKNPKAETGSKPGTSPTASSALQSAPANTPALPNTPPPLFNPETNTAPAFPATPGTPGSEKK